MVLRFRDSRQILHKGRVLPVAFRGPRAGYNAHAYLALLLAREELVPDAGPVRCVKRPAQP